MLITSIHDIINCCIVYFLFRKERPAINFNFLLHFFLLALVGYAPYLYLKPVML